MNELESLLTTQQEITFITKQIPDNFSSQAERNPGIKFLLTLLLK